jgi:hypothetical protein
MQPIECIKECDYHLEKMSSLENDHPDNISLKLGKRFMTLKREFYKNNMDGISNDDLKSRIKIFTYESLELAKEFNNGEYLLICNSLKRLYSIIDIV